MNKERQNILNEIKSYCNDFEKIFKTRAITKEDIVKTGKAITQILNDNFYEIFDKDRDELTDFCLEMLFTENCGKMKYISFPIISIIMRHTSMPLTNANLIDYIFSNYPEAIAPFSKIAANRDVWLKVLNNNKYAAALIILLSDSREFYKSDAVDDLDVMNSINKAKELFKPKDRNVAYVDYAQILIDRIFEIGHISANTVLSCLDFGNIRQIKYNLSTKGLSTEEDYNALMTVLKAEERMG